VRHEGVPLTLGKLIQRDSHRPALLLLQHILVRPPRRRHVDEPVRVPPVAVLPLPHRDHQICER